LPSDGQGLHTRGDDRASRPPLNELSAVNAVSRAEALAPELGKLSTLHASDIIRLAGDFDSPLHLAGLQATASPRIAAELHTSAVAGVSLTHAAQAFVTLLGGTTTDEDQDSPDT
jgi:hypothetical protein